jgi:hypothetical protein
MHRLRAYGLTAALLAGLGGMARAADPAPARGAPPLDTGFRRWNAIPPERPKPPMTPSAAERAERRAKESAAALLAQEQANLLRRIAACDRLKLIALETHNEELEKQADRLLEQAQMVYRQKIDRLPGAKLPETDEPRGEARQVAKQEGKR